MSNVGVAVEREGKNKTLTNRHDFMANAAVVPPRDP